MKKKEKFVRVLFNKDPLIKECDPYCKYETFYEMMIPGIITEEKFRKECMKEELIYDLIPSKIFNNNMIFLLTGIIIGYISVRLNEKCKRKQKVN